MQQQNKRTTGGQGESLQKRGTETIPEEKKSKKMGDEFDDNLLYRGHPQAIPTGYFMDRDGFMEHCEGLEKLFVGATSDPHVTFQWWGDKIPADKFKKVDELRRKILKRKSYKAKVGPVVRLHATIAALLECDELVADIKQHRAEVKEATGLDPQHAGVIPHLSIMKYPSPEAALAAFPGAVKEEVPGFLPDTAEKALLSKFYMETVHLENWEFVTRAKPKPAEEPAEKPAEEPVAADATK